MGVQAKEDHAHSHAHPIGQLWGSETDPASALHIFSHGCHTQNHPEQGRHPSSGPSPCKPMGTLAPLSNLHTQVYLSPPGVVLNALYHLWESQGPQIGHLVVVGSFMGPCSAETGRDRQAWASATGMCTERDTCEPDIWLLP